LCKAAPARCRKIYDLAHSLNDLDVDHFEALMSAQSAKSSFHDLVSGSAASAADLAGLPGTGWHRSSRCTSNGSCVEVAQLSKGVVGVRDGKIGASSPVLTFGQQEWRAFLAAIAAGRHRA
jgi:hypothetical protein